MTNWDDFRLVLALARYGTVRQAGAELGVNHATVSRRLADLTRRMGGAVFERISGRYEVTVLGAPLLEAAERMEAACLEGERRLRAVSPDMAGPVTVSLPDAIARVVLLEELTNFAQAHRDISLTLKCSYAYADLDRSDADIVVRGAAAPDEHLVGRRLFAYALGYYCARDYLQRTAAPDRRWLVRRQPAPWIAHSPYPDAPIGYVIDDIDLLHEAAARGQGMIRGASYIAETDDRLIRMPSSPIEPFEDLWVLTHPDLRHTPRIKAVMGLITNALLKARPLIEHGEADGWRRPGVRQ